VAALYWCKARRLIRDINRGRGLVSFRSVFRKAGYTTCVRDWGYAVLFLYWGE